MAESKYTADQIPAGERHELVSNTQKLVDQLGGVLQCMDPSRPVSIAKTKLDECMMWVRQYDDEAAAKERKMPE